MHKRHIHRSARVHTHTFYGHYTGSSRICHSNTFPERPVKKGMARKTMRVYVWMLQRWQALVRPSSPCMNTLYTPINMRLSATLIPTHIQCLFFCLTLGLILPSLFLSAPLPIHKTQLSFIFLLLTSSHSVSCTDNFTIPHPPLPSSIDVQCPWLWPASRCPRPLTHSASPLPLFIQSPSLHLQPACALSSSSNSSCPLSFSSLYLYFSCWHCKLTPTALAVVSP